MKSFVSRKKRAYPKTSQSNVPEDWQTYNEISKKKTKKTVIEAKKLYFKCTIALYQTC